MNYLSVENLSKSHSDKVLFDSISFGISRGEKTALIARNGTGKTSLLKILAGKDTPDSGQVTVRKDLRIAFLEQEPEMKGDATVLDYILSLDNDLSRLVRNYELALEKQTLIPSVEHQQQLEKLSQQMDDAAAWDYETKVHQILSRLNIHELDKPLRLFSGGQKRRIALARILLQDADLIILDEPTNHLDVEMVEWLEDYLTRSQLALLMVTHDRYFLDNICNRILELDYGKLYTYEGNYSYFLEKKAEREFNTGREKDRASNLLRTELEWMRRMPKARGTKSKARIDAFYELKEKATGRKREQNLELDVKMNRIGGKVIELKKVYKSFGDLALLKGFDYTFRTGERVGIVGKNGTGKSTFLNLLSGVDVPDSGKINVGETIVFGYYSQQGLELKEDKRVIDVVRDYADVIQLSDGTKVQAAQFLNLFQFPPEQQHTFVSKLSGGEKRRLHLLTVLVRNPNFLILDEPTNDLDLLTLGILEDFLMHYKGCLLVVSHDRYFMDKLVDHLFVFEGNGVVRDFNGTYAELVIEREEKLKEQAAVRSAEKVSLQEQQTADTSSRKKMTYKEKLEWEKLEKEIAALEEEKAVLSEKMSSGAMEHTELAGLAERMNKLIGELDDKSMRWLELSEMQG